VDSGETSFGRYRLLNLIGKGAMGQVFRAYDTETDRVVALKVLPPHMAQDEDFKRRFRREAHAAARLNEAHVVPIHGYGEIDGQLFVDMRLIDGQDLSAVLRAEPTGVDQNRAVRIVYQIALALDAAHQAALVHRDVKPSNILITDNDFAYLIDFGVVRATEEVSLTATGLALGTIAYMAPEQFTTGLVDPRSDVYSLTCVLFQCLVGRQPFLGGIEQKAAAHAVAPPPRPSLEKAGLAPELDEVILLGMAKNPNDRYQSALAFAEAARAALDRPAPRAPVPPPPVQGWQPAQFGPPAGFAGPQFPPVVPFRARRGGDWGSWRSPAWRPSWPSWPSSGWWPSSRRRTPPMAPPPARRRPARRARRRRCRYRPAGRTPCPSPRCRPSRSPSTARERCTCPTCSPSGSCNGARRRAPRSSSPTGTHPA
jgi:serine/threonine protein kinase